MKTKRLIYASAAMTAMVAASLMAVNVSAADWSQASYADNDPNTVKMISQTDDSITFTTTATNTDICKARITLDKVLADPADYSKIAKLEWTVTYDGVTSEYKGEALSGGTYVTNTNSEGYSIKPDDYDADENPIWSSSKYVATDRLDVKDPLVENGEIVFMDWSYADIGAYGITVTISDFKIYDADGGEITQLANGAWLDENVPEENTTDAADTAEDAPDEENTVTETETADETAAETETQPVNDNIEENANTGNAGTSIAFGALGLAFGAIIAARKRK